MPELIHSELPNEQMQRIARLLNDIRLLRQALTRGQIRTVYQHLEAARDALSGMLDKVDGKDA